MYDENGNLIPDEIVLVRFENNDNSRRRRRRLDLRQLGKTSTRRKTSTKPRTVTVKKKELPANPMVHELLEQLILRE